MTTMAMARISPRPCSESWNACAAPWKLVAIVDGKVCAAIVCTADTASPSAKPGFKLKEIVTDGSCPVWLTDSGPTDVSARATALSGINRPNEDRTYSSDSDD